MNVLKHIKRCFTRVLPLVGVLVLLGAFTECSSDKDNYAPEVRVNHPSVKPTDQSQFIHVKANGPWTLAIEFIFDSDEESPYEWAYLDVKDRSGTGDRNNIVLRYDSNPYGEDREFDLVLTNAGTVTRTRVLQKGINTGQPLQIFLRNTTVPANDVSQLVRVVSVDSWKLRIEYPSGTDKGWAEIDPVSGSGNKNDVLLSYDVNETGSDRSLTLVLTSGGDEARTTMTQTTEYAMLLEIELAAEEVAATEITQTVNIKAENDWTLALEYPDVSGWASLSAASGTGNQTVTLNYESNVSESDRQVTLVLTDRETGNQSRATLTQKGREKVSIPEWLELPDMSDIKANELFITHNMTINGQRVRNYSMLFDTDTKIAYWVAYPLHTSHVTKAQERTNAWQYDPKVPTDQQAHLRSGWGVSGIDRGHQIPSADRTANYESNAQTFYYTNMTAQLGRFNQYRWQNLEGQVRSWLTYGDKPDSLYVVTGAILKTVNGNETVTYIKDNSGKEIAKPNYYYKVILHRRNDQYRTIGFWYEHRDYGSGNATLAEVKTVRQIEDLTGFNFFSNLPEEVQEQIETVVTPSAWGITK